MSQYVVIASVPGSGVQLPTWLW